MRKDGQESPPDEISGSQNSGGHPPLSLVGIGASAGGIAALREFFHDVPDRTGIAFVVVMHLSPEHESNLAEVLQHAVGIPVRQVRSRIRIEPDHIYVIPPDRTLLVDDGHLDLAEFTEPRGRRTPIDLFFRTLAYHHPDGFGVLLSGSGTDGVVGLMAIKEKGGVILAQSPDEAEYDAMPRAAVTTGMVDFVLPARELGAKVVQLRSRGLPWRPPRVPEDLTNGDSDVLDLILTELRGRTGHDFAGYRKSSVLRRVSRRMHVNQADSLAAYFRYLKGNDAEWQALLKDLLISVTSFFRDAEAFEALEREVIPRIFEAGAAEGRVRVWVAGCATGEEAYSIGMLLLEHADKLSSSPTLQVFATDIDEEALLYARAGLYPEAIAADLTEERLKRFFTPEGGYLRVERRLREIILFSSHNLLRDPPFSRLHLISSRNLLIYLERNLQKRVLKLFRYGLLPDGYLFLGGSENIESTMSGFNVVDRSQRIFRRTSGSHVQVEHLPELPLSLGRAPRHELPGRRTVGPSHAESDAELHREALEMRGPPSILVDRNQDVLHVSERASRYLEFPTGTPTMNLMKVARRALRPELRSALYQAMERGEVTRSPWIPVELDGQPRRIQLYVAPAGAAKPPEFALVVFLESEAAETVADGVDADPDSARRLEVTEAELASVRDRIRDVLEQSEIRQEELKASNEELQSINEEYKSALEELETGKEELQSVNEELKTVNDELKLKVEELARSNNDLRNLMAATQVPTLFLDRELRIKRFTPALADLFNVMPVDEGRPLHHVTHSLDYPGMREDCREVLRTLGQAEREVVDEKGRTFLARITPYRAEEDCIAGVVVTFTDVTRIRQAAVDLQWSEERFRVLVDATAEIVWTTDAHGRAVEDSPSWRAFTGQTRQEWQGWGRLDVVHPDDRDTAEAAWKAAIDAAVPMELEFRLRHAPEGEWRDMSVRAVPVKDPTGEVREWVGMSIDITDRKRAELALLQAKAAAEKSNQAKSQFLATLSHELRTPLTGIIGYVDLLLSGVVGPVDERQLQYLGRTRAGAWHLVTIVDEILTYARMEAGKVSLQPSTVDAAALIREIGPILQVEADSRGVEFRLHGVHEPAMLITDAGKLRQILTNLLGNAVKFTYHGTIDVEVGGDDEWLEVTIRDTGKGIAAEHLEEIFQPFYQVDGTSTRTEGGSGLGLTVSRRLAELMGGDIGVESEEGRGSTFTLKLPRRRVGREENGVVRVE